MASAPAGDGRPRTLGQVVRRLSVMRRLTGRLLISRRPSGPAVTPGASGPLPVRRPWSLLRLWHRMRERVATPADAATDPVARRRSNAAPTNPVRLSTAHPPLVSRPTLSRRGLSPRAPLGAVVVTGPQVRPGHELRMPASRQPAHGDLGSASAAAAGPAATRIGAAAYLPASLLLPSARTRAARSSGAAGDVTDQVSAVGPGRLIPTRARSRDPVSPQRGTARLPAPGRAGSGSPTAGGAAAGMGQAPDRPTGLLSGGGKALAAPPTYGPAVHNPQPVAYLRVLGAAPLPPGSEPDPSGAVTIGRPAAQPIAYEGSPRQRWEAAVAARPLETPRALPTALHAMASAITGRARPPLYTTGAATRHALAAAGALGATTGTVVHLPAVPAPGPAMSAVLAHELTHTRSPVRRPRFFLGGATALLDDDERSALAAGRDRLTGAADGLIGKGRSAFGAASSTAAGIVDQLPVGAGLGAVGDMATRAARAAVLEATAGPLAAASGFADEARGAVTGALDPASGALAGASGLAHQVGAVVDQAGNTVSEVASAVSGGVSAVTGAATAAAAALDPDKVVEIVEQRLLREIERRGGRWAGMF